MLLCKDKNFELANSLAKSNYNMPDPMWVCVIGWQWVPFFLDNKNVVSQGEIEAVYMVCGVFSIEEASSFLLGTIHLLSECQYHRCSEEWPAFVLGKFILTKFIGKQMEAIIIAFAHWRKWMSDKTISFWALQSQGGQEMGVKKASCL